MGCSLQIDKRKKGAPVEKFPAIFCPSWIKLIFCSYLENHLKEVWAQEAQLE